MTNQTTIDAEEINKFANLASHWWDKTGPLKTLHHINPVRLEFITHFLNVSGKDILDVGCGGGILSESLAASGARVTGIDAEPDAIAAATAHAKATHLKINYSALPVEDYEGMDFDAITCMEMLEHVQEPQLVINHCARLIKPGGFLFLSTINRTLSAYLSAILAAEYLLKLLPRQTHDYDKFIKPAELAAMIRNAGLKIVGLKGVGYNPLTQSASIQSSVGVNYLMACFKP